MKRKNNLIFIAFLVCILGICFPGMATSEEATFKIGNVVPFTGYFGTYGKDFKHALELAVEHRGGKLLGKPIELIFEDSASNPKVAVQKTMKVIAAGSQFVVGAFSSSSTLAMMPILKRRKIPHLSMLSTHDDITGKHKTRYTFRTSTSQGVENKIVIEYLKSSDAKNMYIVNADYKLFHDIVSDVKNGLKGSGITIVDTSSAALGTKDFSVIIEKISQSNADTIFAELLGNDLIAFMKQAGQKGLFKNRKVVTTLLTKDLCEATLPYSVNVAMTARYNYALKTPLNEKLIKSHWKLYNEEPQAPDFYDGLTWFMNVIEATGSWDKEKWIEAFEDSSHYGVKGKMVMNASNHQATQDGFFGTYTMQTKGSKDPWGYPTTSCYWGLSKVYKGKALYQ